MANIKILQTSDFLAASVPKECIPQRFAIATNILLCANIDKGEKGFLVFNYEPEKWNQWYPYFSSVNDMYTFEGETYGDIVNVFHKEIKLRADVQARIDKAEKAFLELLGIADGNIVIKDSPVVPEMWLKYSKTQNIWTFYYMEFLQVEQLTKVDLNSLDSNVVDFMPLTEEIIGDVLKTGQYRGIDVVDNTLDIIKNNDILNRIMDGAIVF